MKTELRQAAKLLSGKTILIVDDDALLRHAFGEFFDELGCRVLMAADGEEAMTFFSRRDADISLVLLDLNMPLVSGDEVCLYVQSVAPGTKIIITSSADPEEVRIRLPQAPAVPHLQKPFSVASLLQRTVTLLADVPA